MKLHKMEVYTILAILGIAIFLLIYNMSRVASDLCEISYFGEIKHTVIFNLNEDKVFSVFEMDNVIFEVKNKKIAFHESDCMDKICVNSGFIGLEGEIAVCMPNKMMIKLISASKMPLDAVAK